MLTVNIQLCYVLLSMKEGGLSPDERYFLIRVMFFYDESQSNDTVKELNEIVARLSDGTIQKVRDSLIAKAYILPWTSATREARTICQQHHPHLRFGLRQQTAAADSFVVGVRRQHQCTAEVSHSCIFIFKVHQLGRRIGSSTHR